MINYCSISKPLEKTLTFWVDKLIEDLPHVITCFHLFCFQKFFWIEDVIFFCITTPLVYFR